MNAPTGQADFLAHQTRRAFLGRAAGGFGALALGCLLSEQAVARPARPHFAPRAKRVISLFMSGGPSHVDTFDPKPLLTKLDGQPMPAYIIKNHEFAMIKTKEPKVKGSPWTFRPRGQSGTEISELFPHVAGVADELAVVRSLYSDTFNHDPAVTFMNTGNVRFGWPSLGAWASYGLGTENSDLPAYIVLASGKNIQPLLDSYWGAGFLPPEHQGVSLRTQGDPVLYLKNPDGVSREGRRDQIDLLGALNRRRHEMVNDPAILARIKQYELAFRMQTAVPELADIAREPQSVREAYGAEPCGVSFANNCLLARRLSESGVRFVQLFNGAYQTGGEGVSNWDGHKVLHQQYAKHGPVLDQPAAALLRDLKQRGLLKDTLVVWCTEFGRMPTFQKGASGRDHNPEGFTAWLAGAGVKRGHTYGSTDAFGWKAEKDVATVYDFHATILHLLGLNHKRLTYYHNGFERRLTDVHGHVIQDVLA